MREDEMIGWHHRLNGHEFGSTPRLVMVTSKNEFGSVPSLAIF